MNINYCQIIYCYTEHNNMKKHAHKKPVSFGVLFWIVVILLLIVIFLANKTTIDTVLQETKFFEVIRPASSSELSIEVTQIAPSTGLEIEETGEEILPSSPPISTAEDIATEELLPELLPIDSDTGIQEIIADAVEDVIKDGATEILRDMASDLAPEAKKEEPQPRNRSASLYYISLKNDGTIEMIPVQRTVRYINNPMTETIQALLQGPTQQEEGQGIRSLIPPGTELLSAWIRDGIAYLNFNDSFLFNAVGVEGTIAQLQQVVYSTTEFSTVDKVQILIDGKKIDYLSQEGVYIGEPLGRNG